MPTAQHPNMKFLFVCVSLFVYINAAAVKLPDGVEKCDLRADDRDECIRANFDRVLPKLSNGFPELGIPSLDPLERDTLGFEYKRGPLNVRVTANKIRVVGVSQTKVTKVKTKIDDDSMEAEFEMVFPMLEVSGEYKAENNYEGLQFGSAGKFNISMKDLVTTEKMSGKFVSRDGDKFYELEHFDLKVKMDKFNFYADGIIPDEELTKTVIGFINGSWKSLYQTILSQTKPIWESIVVQETNKILANLPLSSIQVEGSQ